ncbi:FliA/WhiG family RNA polymerase sigma factor [Clostridium sardiniense]|uniref:FliA/WhiG family RNA polymerase sigma factor n=1 Tax=Clostridium sardiniense TaxID=29369 RepID=A0ABS7KVF9_CLOSR|nr:FliA/WhiG family RNA polymerase sigma factor [Clostridium sardiniense]MBY0754647.1 FliA/WhiG family RNA polymerase sigma factor [Clostridium sardiniense]MDQ0460633.1 RNA polymerase sigma factor for flagellar operon FliA [Clostridium sardiniense]
MDREKYILDNINLVRYIAAKYKNNSIGIEYEDLVSYGTMGLLEAFDTFDDTKGCKFSSYASLKIRAAIIDEIRRQSPISRNDVMKINDYNNAVFTLQNYLYREPTDIEISKYLNIPLSEINKIENNIYKMSITSLDNIIFEGNTDVSLIDTIKDDEKKTPLNIIEEEEKIDILTKAIDSLKERDKLILSLYYYEDLTLKEIGKILEVSESRVSQLHSKAIINLRNVIKKMNYNIA